MSICFLDHPSQLHVETSRGNIGAVMMDRFRLLNIDGKNSSNNQSKQKETKDFHCAGMVPPVDHLSSQAEIRILLTTN